MRDCKVNLLQTGQDKRKARAKSRSGPHWEACKWIHCSQKIKGGWNEYRSANTAFAQTVQAHSAVAELLSARCFAALASKKNVPEWSAKQNRI